MTSYRVIDGYRVERAADGTLTIGTGDRMADLELTAADLRALLRFSETGAEPPITDEEREERRKGEEFGKFLDGLMNS